MGLREARNLSSVPGILFVCLGNICRSPLAEGILRRLAQENGVVLHIDSAGTGNWHQGDLPDPRARRVGKSLGCEMDMRARQVTPNDFDDFEHIVAMDRANVRELKNWHQNQPDKICLLRSFDANADSDEVPDPYYGTVADFEEVGRMLERGCRGLLAKLSPTPTISTRKA